MQKLMDKYVQRDGAQDVIWLSLLKVLQAEGICLELASQNTGAIAAEAAARVLEEVGEESLRSRCKKA